MAKKIKNEGLSSDGQEEFEQAPMGGDSKIAQKNLDAEKLNPYHTLIQEMRALADGVSNDKKEKIVTKSIRKNTGTKSSPHFVDAIISARPLIDELDGSEYHPRIYVHTFAVKSMRDEAGALDISSPDDIDGYYIQIDFPEPVGIFVRKSEETERVEKKKSGIRIFHDSIVADAKFSGNFLSIARNFVQRHRGKMVVSGKEFERPLAEFCGNVELPLPRYVHPHEEKKILADEVYRPFALGIQESKFDAHTEFTRDEFHTKFNQLRRRSMQTRHEGDLPENSEYQGILLPRRMKETPERKADVPQFMHDLISALPGGVFVHTRAIGPHDEQETLTSPAEITGYFLSLFFYEYESMIRINSGDPSLVKLIHEALFKQLQDRSENYATDPRAALSPTARTLPKRILQGAVDSVNMKKMKSDIDGVKPLLEFIK